MKTRKQYYIEHSAIGKEWANHKYIAKIGNRYIYTREQLAAAKGLAQRRLGGIGNAISSRWAAVKNAASSMAANASNEARKDIRKIKATKNSLMSRARVAKNSAMSKVGSTINNAKDSLGITQRNKLNRAFDRGDKRISRMNSRTDRVANRYYDAYHRKPFMDTSDNIIKNAKRQLKDMSDASRDARINARKNEHDVKRINRKISRAADNYYNTPMGRIEKKLKRRKSKKYIGYDRTIKKA